MTDKKKKSFAARANELSRKYTRRESDPIEMRDFELQMEALVDEQEAARESLGLNQPQQEFATGGKMMYQGGGSLGLLPRIEPDYLYDAEGLPLATTPDTSTLAQRFPTVQDIGDVGGEETSLLPSYISAGAAVGGNILASLLDKKPEDIDIPTYRPQELDLTERKLQAEERAGTAKAGSLRRTRDLGLSPGATIANQAAIDAGIERDLSGTLTDIATAEEQFGAGERAKAAGINIEGATKEQILNQQLQDQFKQRQIESLTGAVGVLPELMLDINRIKEQDRTFNQLSDKERALIEILGKNYKFLLGEGNVPTSLTLRQ